jgi:hypothetical protein
MIHKEFRIIFILVVASEQFELQYAGLMLGFLFGFLGFLGFLGFGLGFSLW